MLLLFIMGIIPAFIVENVVVQSYENRAVSQRTIIVRNQCDMLMDSLVSSDYIQNPSNEAIDGELRMLTSIYAGRVLIIDKSYRVIKDTYGLDSGKFLISKEVKDTFNGEEMSRYDDRNQYIELTVRIDGSEDGKKEESDGVMLISVSAKEIHDSMRLLENRGTSVLALTVILILILGYLLSGILVRPFQKITTSIENIQEGEFDEKINVPDYLETELITNAFNRLLDRLKAVDDSRSEFVSNVSHELKTPLTSVKVLADSLNMDPNADLATYKEFMKDISGEIDRENSIISDLLTLVRLDKRGSEELNITKVDINEELRQIVKRLTPIADKAGVQLILDSYHPVTAEIDETKLTLAITNIIENAIKYNQPQDGWVRISMNSDKKYFYLTISDNGIGIPKEDLDHIFERFYRVDKSHSREIGGTGLGLAITRSTIRMHHGAIRVNSTLGKGTVFSVRIPLVYVA
ncbi:MAG: ATP-binding protein [Eubacterium sp.]|nr:ATP-binding protein [Eubacterium sp.]